MRLELTRVGLLASKQCDEINVQERKRQIMLSLNIINNLIKKYDVKIPKTDYLYT